MAYTKTTNFAIKDTYLSGNPAKVVKGSEIDDEFGNIETTLNGIGPLGNAAEATLATSATDLTPGRVPTTGAFNLGTGNFAKNKIINGSFDIWQRGTSFSTQVYTADRWLCTSANTTITRQLRGDSAAYYLELAGSAGATNAQVLQRIESFNAVSLAGKTATFSIDYMRQAGSFPLKVIFSTPIAVDNFGTLNIFSTQTLVPGGGVTGAWARVSCTVNVPASASNGLQILIFSEGSGASMFALSLAQLEVGSVATPFEHRPIGQELALCQRYFETSHLPIGAATLEGAHHTQNSTGFLFANGSVRYINQKRAAPTITIFSCQTGAPGQVSEFDYANVFVTDRAVGSIRAASTSSFYAQSDGTSVIGNFSLFNWTASAEL